MIIRDESTQLVVADKAVMADTVLSRMCGLLGKAALAEGEALAITRCQSIHMFFMRFPIDVVFVDRSKEVVGLVKRIPPFALSPVFWKASMAIEIPAGTIDRLGIAVGHRMVFEGPGSGA